MKRRFLALFLIVALLSTMLSTATSAKEAAPVQSHAISEEAEPGRVRLNFNQGWKFVRRYIPEAIEPDYPLEYLEGWESVNLPHTVRLEPYNTSGGINYQGQAMYRKHFSVPEEYVGKKMFVEFEAAMGVTDVWLNGEHLQTKIAAKTGSNTHYGGYLPIVLDITDYIKADEENVMVVLVDNSDNTSVPPGKPQSQLDFTYMGGIYRNAWIDVMYPVHITNANYEDIVAGGGILVDYPAVTKEEATVSVQTHIRNEFSTEKNVTLTTEIVDKEGAVVGSMESNQRIQGSGDHTFKQNVVVKNPKLWNLDDPYLHTLVSIVKIDGQEVDRQETTIGIRKIEISADQGVTINGENAGFLSGVNRHQEYPYIGFAASTALQRRDAIKFKSAGFNFVRTAHHPQSPDFLEACDELGILVMESVPGWQHWSDDPNFAIRVKEDIRQMVRRDRNHACILTFEISLNESPGVPNGFTNELEHIAKEEHPSVKTSAENPHAGAVADVLYGKPEEVASWSNTACAVIREYADLWSEQFGNFGTECRVTRGTSSFYPGGEARMVNQANRALWLGYYNFGTGSLSLAQGLKHYEETNHRFIGINKWIGIDHNRGYHETMSPCGIWDLMRLPKYMYYAYASQRPVERDPYLESLSVETGPMLFIASSWSETAPELDKSDGQKLGTDEARLIYVYSNAETVELSVIKDGEVLWSKEQSPATRDNATYLAHAPFEFTDVPYTAGSYLLAEGKDAAGSVIASQEVHTAGAPAKLELVVDDEGIALTADGSDAVMVYAYVKDADGNLCQTADNLLHFSVTGPASIVGDGDQRVGANPVKAEAGIMGVYIQSGMDAGDITVTVNSEGLESASITFRSEELTAPVMPYTKIKDGPPIESKSMYLTEKEGEEIGYDPKGFNEGNINVQGQSYANSLNVRCMTPIRYQLEGNYRTLTGKIALENPGLSVTGTIFKVYLDGTLAYVSEPVKDQVLDLNVDVSGAQEMILVAEDNKGINSSRILWLSPYLIEGSTPKDESELRQNVALNVNVETSGSQSGREAAFAVDGAADTYWQSAAEVSAETPQWLLVDLGEKTDLRNARIALKNDYFSYTYQIEVSADFSSWHRVAENTKSAHGSDLIDEFTAAGVQYVRITFTEIKSTQGESVGPLLADLVEFEVYRDLGISSVAEYNLKGLEVAGKPFAFDPAKTVYEVERQGFENVVYIKALPVDPNAIMTINGQKATIQSENLNEVAYQPYTPDEQGEIHIEVTSANGKATKEYIIRLQNKAEQPGIYHASDCFVPGVNGAYGWHYQTLTANGVQNIDSVNGGIVAGEYAYKGGDWFYSGSRFMHPSSDASEYAIRAFTVPESGNIVLNVKAAKILEQPGTVTLAIYHNEQKVWPADGDSQQLASTSPVSISLPLTVNSGDTLQIRLGCAGDGNGGDATSIISAVYYPNALQPEHVEIKGQSTIVLTDDKSASIPYQYVAETENGIVVPDFAANWSMTPEIDGIEIDQDGVLQIAQTVKDASFELQVLHPETGEVMQRKSIVVRRLLGEQVYLSDLKWTNASAGDASLNNGLPYLDRGWMDVELSLPGYSGEMVTFEKGIGTHADSTITYDLSDADYQYFVASIGVSYTQSDEKDPHLVFKVLGDGETLYESETMYALTPYENIVVDISGVEVLVLEVSQSRNNWCAHANWANAMLISAEDTECKHNLQHFNDKEATCTEAGNIEYWRCEICGIYFADAEGAQVIAFEDTVIDPLGHKYEKDWSSDKSGHWHGCSRCEEKTDEAAHTPGTPATETTPQTCTVCGYVIAPATGHVTHTPDTSKWYIDETNHWHKCTGCEERLDVSAHTGGEATCISKAKCAVCGQEYGETNPDNHKNVKLVGWLPATPVHEGYTGDQVCQDCGKTLREGKVIPKKSGGNTPVDPVEPSEPDDYYDVSVGDWYYDAVSYVTEEGLMTGVGNGKFNPNGAVTRAMVWTVLARMDGENTDGGATWYSKAQAWAMETGVSDGTNPMGSITREQLAAMLYRYEGSPAVSGNLGAYPDANTVSDWAVDAMVWATEEGIINGINGYLKPQDGATRAQLAAMLMRFVEAK